MPQSHTWREKYYISKGERNVQNRCSFLSALNPARHVHGVLLRDRHAGLHHRSPRRDRRRRRFLLRDGASSNPSVGLNFGTLGSTATPATTSAPSGGFGTGLLGSKPTTGFTLGGTNTGIAATITTGLTLGTPATTSASTTGFSLGFSKPAASATPFALPITSTSARGLTLSSALTSTPAGLGQNTLGLTFGTTVATSTAGNEGLGGIDFRTSSDKKSDKTGTRPDDSKALKDENLPPVICQDVENLQKFVKEQKQVQEEISRMSSKAMLKVQEDIKTLSLAASGLQRNTLSIDELKTENAQFEVFHCLLLAKCSVSVCPAPHLFKDVLELFIRDLP
ncbi:nucleoporin p58/p45-like [Mustela putorius furo]|uniref:Nucleoporin p58/p45-like n=1 Tax=Mustela putorius furo TaxID=9669 RepID=A0A8U0RNS1_MUSPF|nr:nucleoporin p58/p45-like [Mustela putorius furo]